MRVVQLFEGRLVAVLAAANQLEVGCSHSWSLDGVPSSPSCRVLCLSFGCSPVHGLEASDPPQSDVQALGSQQLALDVQIAAVAAQGASGRDDSVTGNRRI